MGPFDQITKYLTISVRPEYTDTLLPVLRQYQACKKSGKYLLLNFTSLTDYLWLLRAATQALAPIGKNALLYLAAAVSDFYLPQDQIVSIPLFLMYGLFQ